MSPPADTSADRIQWFFFWFPTDLSYDQMCLAGRQPSAEPCRRPAPHLDGLFLSRVAEVPG